MEKDVVSVEKIKVSGDLSLERGARNLERIKIHEKEKEKEKDIYIEKIKRERSEYIEILQKLYTIGVTDVAPIKNIIDIFNKRLEMFN